MIKRKYDLATIMIIVATLTTLAVFGLMFVHFNNTLGLELREVAQDETTISADNILSSTKFIADDLPKYGDNYLFWFFVATFVGLVLTALYLDFEPAVMIVLFIFGSIGILGAWLGSEIYGEFAVDADLAVTATEMSKTELLMSSPYFPVFIFVGLVVMLVIMYNRKGAGEYQ
jgi:hypothetical protein